ncbi:MULTISPECIES: Cd(II)/Pb(II)-responsive transcriptional regulator [Paraglaciecola]|jgi:Cd(II)/Pb(II)-responsive transcriptional regulator|uniref:HTH-type transcriptional regulator zntR homolog n=2 Tax=Paraglaciecola TaxID=1621534 RepID=K6ZVM0_9ALTE|nr:MULTISPECIES: Cd(II)/Pb(II)-responsive transcriptional regulator [Paraglaciecola]MAD17748.1 Cd(II)/Pb(II)-responsive transcriptional regulator [Alteromonadaceae bacterium]MBB18289.1 Cd(II)/Pb(II)-responsive transcriptional regulator [Rickettsiales bacterium]GAC34297.1 HTH-type transcriptional regulator zntR homolog [Paraglaciecola polaris LMG 21857]|tara:strand:- start:674 stop:1063 length:390 start_codon:yes stop_codon:yes gene_type:complete
MKIGELSKKSGCSIQTVRFYEKQHLFKACNRTEGNYRIYDASSLSTLRFIKQCRSLGLTIIEIKQLLDTKMNPDRSCTSVNNLIHQHMTDVTKRIEELNELKQTLTDMALACSDNRKVKECGVLQMLEK